MTDKATDVPVTMKPCPKCGGRAFIAPHPTGFPVWCIIDRCLRLPPRETKAEAIAAWNHRTASEQPASDEAVEAAFQGGFSAGFCEGMNEGMPGHKPVFCEDAWRAYAAALPTTSESPRGVNCPDCGGRIATACPHCGAEPMTDADIATLTPSALSGEPVQKVHELPRDVGARAIELLREYMDAEEIDDVDARSSELGACRFSVRAFLETVPSALSGDAGEGESHAE